VSKKIVFNTTTEELAAGIARIVGQTLEVAPCFAAIAEESILSEGRRQERADILLLLDNLRDAEVANQNYDRASATRDAMDEIKRNAPAPPEGG